MDHEQMILTNKNSHKKNTLSNYILVNKIDLQHGKIISSDETEIYKNTSLNCHDNSTLVSQAKDSTKHIQHLV